MTPETPPPPKDWTMHVLVWGLVLYTFLALAAAIWVPTNEHVYALLAGIAGNFSGALFLRLKG